MTKNQKAAIRVARTWANVPETMSDDEAMKRGFISPDMIALIMSIFMELFTNCFSNRQANAWNRLRSYTTSNKPFEKMTDNVRLKWQIDRWMNRLAFPRDRGDVVELAAALELEASSIQEDEFVEIQNEQLFMTV